MAKKYDWYKNGKGYTNESGLSAGYIRFLADVRENNAKEIAEAIDSRVATALEAIGLLAEGYAKKKCPVDTGRLRNSITHQVDAGDDSVYIGTNVEYGPYVELGTSTQAAQPFLRPAAEEHASQYRAVLRKYLSS